MNTPRRPIRWLPLALLLAAVPTVHAQEPPTVRRTVLPGLDSQVAARLIALDRRLNPAGAPDLAASLVAQLAPAPLNVFTPLLADSRNVEVWDQLPEEYYRITQESGDALATLAESPPHLGVGWSSGQVRRLCHQRLALLPRASLDQYRQRVDAEAKALLEQGRRERSPAPLRRLADELFCSSHAEAAIDLLGDLAFEKGQFDEARYWWGLLAPLDGVRDDRLVFPLPKLDLPRVQAKQILALIFQGRLDEAQAEIPRFLQLHAKARGQLAGHDELYAVTLQKTLLAFAKERIRNNDEPWTTFGGSPTRSRILSQGLSWQLWEDGPAWSVPLPSLDAKEARPDRAFASRRAAFHPVIVNHQVLIADQRSVISYHLTTGKELFRVEPKGPGLTDLTAGIDAKIAMPRFTLSADHERAYVRLGKLGMAPNKETASYLICIDLTQPDVVRERELWRVRANADEKQTFFEGSPLVHDGRVYIALSKILGRRVVTSIVCYDVLGRKRWSREVCDCPEFEDHVNGGRYRQHLLTLAGGQIVYCSHAGAIVAVDAWTGQPTWGARYPSRGPLTAEHEPSPRDLVPAVYADGLVFAAPLDSDRIFCLDAVTGQLRWELDSVEVVHMLGVAHNHLFAATRNGVMSIHALSGAIDWSQPSEGRLPSLGRGLIAGGWLLWPTRDEKVSYRAVTLRGGMQQKDGDTKSVLPEPDTMYLTMLRKQMPPGNLAFGQGCLAIAGLNELTVYVPAHKIKSLPPPDARPDARIKTLYDTARILASLDRSKEAEATYRQLLDATKTQPNSADWRALIESRIRERKRPQPIAIAKAIPPANLPPVLASLSLPLVQSWSHEDGKVWPINAEEYCDDCFFCSSPERKQREHAISCRNLADGSLRWQASLDFEPIWLGRWGNLVLISGTDSVQAMRVDDGKLAWTFAAPSRQWRLGSLQNGVPKLLSPAAGIVHVERWDDTLLVLDDHRHVYRLRLDTGEIAWQYAAPAAALRPIGAASFAPHALPIGHRLLMQSVTGQPFWLDGKASTPSPTNTGAPSHPWRQTPLLIGNTLVLAENEGRVIANVKLPPHERLWTYQPPWPTSLSGEPCRLHNKGSVLIVFVPRNEGYDCVRLNPERGTLIWSITARQLPPDLGLASMCIGDLSFYYVHAGKLHARSLNDGSSQWTQNLPTRSANWHIRYTKDYLAVYPASGAKDDAFTVSFVDPIEGQLLQRLAFPDARGPGDVLLTPRQVIVSAGGRICGFHSLDHE